MVDLSHFVCDVSSGERQLCICDGACFRGDVGSGAGCTAMSDVKAPRRLDTDSMDESTISLSSTRQSLIEHLQREVESAAVQLQSSGVVSFTLIGTKLTCTFSEDVSENLCANWTKSEPITLTSHVHATYGVRHQWSCCGSQAPKPARHSDAVGSALPPILQVVCDVASRIAELMAVWKAQHVCPDCAVAMNTPSGQQAHFVHAHVDSRTPISELDEVYEKVFFWKVLVGGDGEFPTAASIEAATHAHERGSSGSPSSPSSPLSS